MYTESFDSAQQNEKSFLKKICHQPLFLQLVGPFFLLLNLSGLVACFSFAALLFCCAATLGYVFSLRYQIKGAMYSFGLLGFSGAFLFLIDSLPFSIGMTLLCILSFSAAYFLIGLASESLNSLQQEKEKQADEKITALQISYETNLKYLETQLDDQLEHGKSLDKALKIQDKELLSLRQLIQMSHLEAEKYKQDSIEHKALIETYHQTLVSYEEKQEEVFLIQQRAKQLVKNLNHERVEAFQNQLLLEDYQRQTKDPARKAFNSCASSSEELTYFQQERARIKQCYYEQLQTYHSLAMHLESSFERQEESEAKAALTSLENQGKLLQDLRLDILKVEESIMHLKKELKHSSEEGLSTGSYLAIADQECVRLEEENNLLLKLLMTTSAKSSSKKEIMTHDETQNI